jgi:hypothetical protein
MEPVPEVMDWHLGEAAMKEIDTILGEIIEEPVGPEFMVPPHRA